MLDSDKLLALISEGESETLEFKQKLPPERVISAILAAFANTKGGTLIIGVGDKGQVIGLTKNEAILSYERLRKAARSLLFESFDGGMTSVNGRWLVYITVEEAPKHLSPITTAAGKDFVRIGTRVDTRGGAPDDTRSGGVVLTKGVPAKTYIAFVAMSFREEEEPALVDYYRAIERATLKTRFSVNITRIDLVEGDYEISQKLMDEIDKADIIVADFTLRPSNVYFELGYARGRRKRIIQTARKDTVLEFDIRNWRTIFYRNATELEEKLAHAFDAACAELAKTNVRDGV